MQSWSSARKGEASKPLLFWQNFKTAFQANMIWPALRHLGRPLMLLNTNIASHPPTHSPTHLFPDWASNGPYAPFTMTLLFSPEGPHIFFSKVNAMQLLNKSTVNQSVRVDDDSLFKIRMMGRPERKQERWKFARNQFKEIVRSFLPI